MRRRFLSSTARPRRVVLALVLAASSVSAQFEVAAQDAREQPGLAAAPPAAEPRIADVRLAFDDQQILLSFKLLDAFDETVSRRLESGLPTGFTYQFQLVRSRKRWFDKAVDKGTLQVGAMYNAVSRQYLINFKHDGGLIESRVVKDLGELRAAMTELHDFPVFSTAGKNPSQRLRVRLRAELRTRTLFFFIPSTVHTDWAETRKFRISEELD